MSRLLAALLVAACGAAPAQDPAKPPAEPGISFSFDNKKWSEVIDWFKTESGLVYAGTVTPTGSVSIKPNPGKRYTIPQVVDLLNELLAPRYVLIRRGQSFTLLPSDDPIEQENVRQLQDATELAAYGRTELVQLVVPLGPLAWDDIAPSVRFLLSSVGKISPFGATAVIVQDKVRNVELIVAAVAKLAKNADAQERYSHPCRYVRATTAAEMLKSLLGPDAMTTDFPYAPYAAVPGGRPDRALPRSKAVRISVQEPANVVLVTGPADKVDLARKVLHDDIDRGAPGTELQYGGEPSFRTYPVAPGSAATAAAALLTQFKNTSVVVVPVGTDRIHVYGFPADHAAIARQVLANDPDARGEPVTEIIPLADADPKTTAGLLTRVFPPVGGLPFVEAQDDGLLVRGTTDQLRRIRDEIRKLEPADRSSLASNRRTVRLGPGFSSGILAEVLADFARKAGSDAYILDPVAPPERPKPAPRLVRKRTPPAERTNPMPPAGESTAPMPPAGER